LFAINPHPSDSELRKFGWAMLTGFGVLGLLAWLAAWRVSENASLIEWTGSGFQIAASVMGLLAVSLFALAVLSPAAAKPVYVAWMSATMPIGVVMSTILLTVLYFLLLPVFAWIVRRGDPMRKRLSPSGTYWEPYKPHEPTLERMQRPF